MSCSITGRSLNYRSNLSQVIFVETDISKFLLHILQRYFTQKAEKKKKVDEEDEESDESVSDTEFDDFLG